MECPTKEREHFRGRPWRPKKKAKTSMLKSLLLCSDVRRKPMTTVFKKASKHWASSLNPQHNTQLWMQGLPGGGGTDRMFYAPEKEEVHDTYANSWWNVFTMAKSECVHQSVYAWLKQIHCSLIRRVRFRKGLTNWGYSKYFTVYQLWNVYQWPCCWRSQLFNNFNW